VRRHGWGGDPPADDREARERIIAAAMLGIDRHGAAGTSLSDVAATLGVTRQTVYRYFPSTERLFAAVGETAADTFLDEVAAHVRGIEPPAELVVEALAHAVEELPHRRYLMLLADMGRPEAFTREVTSPVAMRFGRELLRRAGVDRASGYGPAELDDLVELLLRLLQSFTVDPGTPPRRGPALRAYLRRWIGPALAPSAAHTPRRR
jgi:AcrR family transcriptional regulator